MGNKEKEHKLEDIAKKEASLNQEIPTNSIEQSLLEILDGLSDEAAMAVLDAFQKIPKEVIEAVNKVYETLQRLGDETTVDEVKKSLIELKEVCGEENVHVYKIAARDAKRYVPKIQARQFRESLEV